MYFRRKFSIARNSLDSIYKCTVTQAKINQLYQLHQLYLRRRLDSLYAVPYRTLSFFLSLLLSPLSRILLYEYNMYISLNWRVNNYIIQDLIYIIEKSARTSAKIWQTERVAPYICKKKRKTSICNVVVCAMVETEKMNKKKEEKREDRGRNSSKKYNPRSKWMKDMTRWWILSMYTVYQSPTYVSYIYRKRYVVETRKSVYEYYFIHFSWSWFQKVTIIA